MQGPRHRPGRLEPSTITGAGRWKLNERSGILYDLNNLPKRPECEQDFLSATGGLAT